MNGKHPWVLFPLCGLIVATPFSMVMARMEAPLHLQKTIETIRGELKDNLLQQHHLQEKLSQGRRTSIDLQNRMKRTQQAIQQAKTNLKTLEDKKTHLHKKLQQAQHTLEAQITQAYLLSRKPWVKLILNKEEPSQVKRYLFYYQTLSQTQWAQTQQWQDAYQALHRLSLLKEQKTKELEALLHQSKIQLEKIAATQKQGQKLFSQLDHKILQQNHAITQLLEQLHNQSGVNLPSPPLPFTHLRGQLPWPITGHIQQAKINASLPQRHNGVYITAPTQQSVRAVAEGQVVFSDHLPGFGRLIIIDHGQGAMTLYGNNEQLFKQAGEAVEAGEALALSEFKPKNATKEKSRLYFEIRLNGIPQNPLLWFG